MMKLPSFAPAVSLRRAFRPAYLGLAVLVLFCAIVGAAMPIYVNLMGGQASRLVAFPAALIFGLMLIYDRRMMLLAIIVTRASGDYFLTLTKFSLAGMQIGIGGLINAIVIIIAILLVFEKPGEVPRKAYVMWLPFLIVALLSIPISPDKSGAIRSWLGQISSFAIFVSAFHFVRTPEEFRKCVRLILWSALFPCFFGFVDIALHHGSAGDDGEGFRVASTFGHPNEFAFYLTLIIALAFYMIKTLPKKNYFRNSVALGAYMLLLFGMLILTKTRSAWFACILGFALYAVFFQPRYLLYMLVLGVLALFVPGVADRLADLDHGNQVSGYSKLNSFAWRVYLWESGLKWMTPAHYLFGYGFTSFKEFSPVFFPLAGKINWNAHSLYVQIIFELGAAGVATYFWIYYHALTRLKTMLKLDKLAAFTLIIIVINYLISSASDNMIDYLAFNWYLWFSVGIGFAYVRSQDPGVDKRDLPFGHPAGLAVRPRQDISYR